MPPRLDERFSKRAVPSWTPPLRLIWCWLSSNRSLVGSARLFLVSDADGPMRTYYDAKPRPDPLLPPTLLSSNARRAFDDFAIGGLSERVPGMIAALAMAHCQFGEWSRHRLFELAIVLAQDGCDVSRRLAAEIPPPEIVLSGNRATLWAPPQYSQENNSDRRDHLAEGVSGRFGWKAGIE